MNVTADTTYISKAIDEIISLVGIKKQIEEGVIFHEFRMAHIKKCIEYIAYHLNLPIAVNLFYVSSDYIVEENEKSGRGTGTVAAQVSIPGNMPFYGSPQFVGFPIDVKVSNNCLKYPETFIGIMAHELSHIVLHSLRHKEKNSEIYTDLAAMVLGFSDIVKKGRKNFGVRQNASLIETSTTTYGYLSDSQFNYAYAKINKILADYIAIEDAFRSGFIECRECLHACKRESSRLDDLLQYIDKKQNRRMRFEDAVCVIQMHEPGYVDKIRSVINKSEKQMDDMDSVLGSLLNYNSKTLDTLKDCQNRIQTVSVELSNTLHLIRTDISVLEKYQGFFLKIRNSLKK